MFVLDVKKLFLNLKQNLKNIYNFHVKYAEDFVIAKAFFFVLIALNTNAITVTN